MSAFSSSPPVPWLRSLRWYSLLLLVGIGTFYNSEGHGPSLIGVTCIGIIAAAVNGILYVSSLPHSPSLIGSILLFDVMALTLTLLLSGGIHNPFSILYLVYVTLSAVILGTKWTWVVTCFSILAFGTLFYVTSSDTSSSFDTHLPISIHERGIFSRHLRGMWEAFVATALITAYFLTKIVESIKQRDARLQRLEVLAKDHERLASLTTLAAGAAHELSTPLSTIAVIASELRRNLLPSTLPRGVIEDLHLLGEEVIRCHSILEDMSYQGGEVRGESFTHFSFASFEQALTNEIVSKGRNPSRIRFVGETPYLYLPKRALVKAVGALIINGLDASGDTSSVLVTLSLHHERLLLSITDKGEGMSQETLTRVGEPFFSTKEPGRGMGLGLYLARRCIVSLEGELSVASTEGRGTTITISLPCPSYSGNNTGVTAEA
jgi:two-component system, sensor histidine kinase RegB